MTPTWRWHALCISGAVASADRSGTMRSMGSGLKRDGTFLQRPARNVRRDRHAALVFPDGSAVRMSWLLDVNNSTRLVLTL